MVAETKDFFFSFPVYFSMVQFSRKQYVETFVIIKRSCYLKSSKRKGKLPYIEFNFFEQCFSVGMRTEKKYKKNKNIVVRMFLDIFRIFLRFEKTFLSLLL